MSLLETVYSSFRSVYGYKMRSLLTMLGIIIGISSVIMIMSVGQGVQDAIFAEMDSFNFSNIQVSARNFAPGSMTIEDAEAISQLNNVSSFTAFVELPNQKVQLRSGSETKSGTAWGLDQNYHNVEEVNMLYGRFITEQDVNNNAFVTVITPELSVDVFGRVNSVGESLYVEGQNGRYSLRVVGIVDVEPSSIGAQTPLLTGLFILPTTTAGVVLNTPGKVDFISVLIEDQAQVAVTARQITDILNMRHDREDAFFAISQSVLISGLDAVFASITAFVAFVAAISLFVGGVGVMNIMMVTVTERTREIGIKKSLGATNGIIKLQFVFESLILTSIGGIIGIILGLVSAKGLGMIMTLKMPFEINPSIQLSSIIGAVSISVFVGIVFGVYPASKAAKLDPIEALRYE